MSALTAERWEVTPPTQERSRRTTERIVTAVEALLQDRPFEQITIQEIVAKARTTTGSFYARFASKDALLPYIYARYDADLATRVSARLAEVPWDTMTLEECVRARVRVMIEMYEDRHWLLRAVSLYARMHPGSIPETVIARRSGAFEKVKHTLDRFRDQITHPDLAEAFAFVMFLITSTGREAIVFGDAPQARITPGLRDHLEDNLTRAAFGFLTTPPRGP